MFDITGNTTVSKPLYSSQTPIINDGSVMTRTVQRLETKEVDKLYAEQFAKFLLKIKSKSKLNKRE